MIRRSYLTGVSCGLLPATLLAGMVNFTSGGRPGVTPGARLAGPAPARSASAPRAPGLIRVGLTRASGAPAVGLRVESAGTLLDLSSGERLRTLFAGERVTLVAEYATGRVLARGAGYSFSRPGLAVEGGVVQVGSRRYPGRLEAELGGTGLQLASEVDIEQYLQGVLPGELPSWFGMEAQKALAVCARSYALVQRGKHSAVDLCDRPHCQMYVGHRTAASRAIEAVRATRGEVLWSGEELVYAFYSADCGGITTFLEQVPLPDKPEGSRSYLQLVRDARPNGKDYCSGSPYHFWTYRISRDVLQERLNADPETQIGWLVSLKVTRKDESGRVTEMLLQGQLPQPVPGTPGEAAPVSWIPVEKRLPGWSIRRAVGTLRIKSTLFRLDQPNPGVFRFTGRGFGHGLGLCQIGADARAKAGQSYRQILAHYYPGSRVGPLAAPAR